MRKPRSSKAGGALITISTFSWAITQWFMVWIFARKGGPEAAGEYSALLSLLTPIFIVASLGLRTIYLTHHRVWPLRTYLNLRFLGLATGGAVFLSIALLERKFTVSLILAMVAVRTIDLITDVYGASIQRQERLAWLGLLGISTSLLTACAVATAVLLGGSLSAAVGASALVYLAVLGVYWHTAKPVDQDVTEPADGPLSGASTILRASVPVTVGQGIAGVAAYLPILLLGRWADTAIVGVFTGAAYLITAANLVGSVAHTILISSFRRQFSTQGAWRTYRRALKICGVLLLVVLALIPAIVFLGNPVLQFVYGPQFSLPRVALLLLSVAVVPIAPSYLFSAVLAVYNRFRAEAIVWLCAVVVATVSGAALLSTSFDPLNAGMVVAAVLSWTRFLGVFILTRRAATRVSPPSPVQPASLTQPARPVPSSQPAPIPQSPQPAMGRSTTHKKDT